MQKPPSVAVVIPAYNEENTIEACLQACFNQTVPFTEIIIVNNKSTDQTESIIRRLIEGHPEARLLQQNEFQGLVPTRDMGLDAATADIIGRIDADSILDENWVAAVQEVFQNSAVAAASGPVLYHDMPLPKVGLKLDEKIRSALHRTAKNHRFLFGTNMAIRRSVWHEAKPLLLPDPNDEHHEDISIALTLFQNGFEIVYAPNMIAGMSARRVEDSPKDFYNYVMRFERTYKAHGVKGATARVPIFIYLLIYFPVRTIRRFYDGDTNKFTLRKLREELKLPQDS